MKEKLNMTNFVISRTGRKGQVRKIQWKDSEGYTHKICVIRRNIQTHTACIEYHVFANTLNGPVLNNKYLLIPVPNFHLGCWMLEKLPSECFGILFLFGLSGDYNNNNDLKKWITNE